MIYVYATVKLRMLRNYNIDDYACHTSGLYIEGITNLSFIFALVSPDLCMVHFIHGENRVTIVDSKDNLVGAYNFFYR